MVIDLACSRPSPGKKEARDTLASAQLHTLASVPIWALGQAWAPIIPQSPPFLLWQSSSCLPYLPGPQPALCSAISCPYLRIPWGSLPHAYLGETASLPPQGLAHYFGFFLSRNEQRVSFVLFCYICKAISILSRA